MTETKHPLPYVPPVEERRERLRALYESMSRQGELLNAWAEVPFPDGLTADEFRATARRFAALAEQVGPRRGLCRFGRNG